LSVVTLWQYTFDWKTTTILKLQKFSLSVGIIGQCTLDCKTRTIIFVCCNFEQRKLYCNTKTILFVCCNSWLTYTLLQYYNNSFCLLKVLGTVTLIAILEQFYLSVITLGQGTLDCNTTSILFVCCNC
jgi:hypothetical protein